MIDLTKEGRFSHWIFNSFSVTAEGLGLYRIFAALFILFFLLPSTEMYSFLGSLPSEFYAPPPGPMWLFYGFPPESVFYVLHGLFVVSLLCLLVGYKTSLASILAGVLLLAIKGLFYSVGKINHDLLLSVVPIVMAFSCWGSAYSVDSLLHSNSDAESKAQSWPLTLLALIIGFMMFTAGFPKILGGWLDPDTHATFGRFFKQYFVNNRQDLLADYAIHFDNYFLWELLDYLTIFFEVGFLLAVLHPKTTRLFVSIAIVFHFSVMILLNIAFLPNLVAYAAFLNWSFIHQKITDWYKGKWGPLLLLAVFFGVILGMIFLGGYFNTPTLNSDLQIHEFYLLVSALPIALWYILYQGYAVLKSY